MQSPEEVRSRSSSRRSSRRNSLKKETSLEERRTPKKETLEERRNSLKKEASLEERRNSLKKEASLEERRSKKEGSLEDKRNSPKKERSLDERQSTPKRTQKTTVDFLVTGKQIVKRCDRANSLPGGYHRRQASADVARGKRDSKRVTPPDRSRDTSLEEDMSLDLSQVSDFEDTNSKYGIKHKPPLATSTPKPRPGPKPRSASLQSHLSHLQRIDTKRTQMSLDGASFSCSRDSLYNKTTSSSASPYRCGTELDYSSVSPEYSGQSSTDLSPRATTTDLVVSPRSHNVSSCCVSSWQEGSEAEPTRVEAYRPDGEWNDFWVNYNNSLAKVPMKSYYDQCPTPYRTENIDLNDFDFSVDSSRKRSPDNIKNLNNIIRNEGLQLTPRETQNIIKCAHILGNVLSKAIERRSRENENTKIEELNISSSNTVQKEKESEIDLKKKNLTLNLKETALPIEVKEEKRQETVTTQTDISLPNTKSAPIIFERILKQLSKSSIDEADEDDDVFDVKDKK